MHTFCLNQTDFILIDEFEMKCLHEVCVCVTSFKSE